MTNLIILARYARNYDGGLWDYGIDGEDYRKVFTSDLILDDERDYTIKSNRYSSWVARGEMITILKERI